MNNRAGETPVEANPVRPVILEEQPIQKGRRRIFTRNVLSTSNLLGFFTAPSRIDSTDAILDGLHLHHHHTEELRLPKPGTNIDDIRRRVDFHQFDKRFIIVGLNSECHAFRSLDDLIVHIQSESGSNDVSTYLNAGGKHAIWIDIQLPSKSDIKKMERHFGIHPLTAEDILRRDASEKWEIFPDYMYIVFVGQVDDELPVPDSLVRRVREDTVMETYLNVLVYENFVITVHEFPIKGLDILMRRIEVEHEIDVRNLPSDEDMLMKQYDELRTRKRLISEHKSSEVLYKLHETNISSPSSSDGKSDGKSEENVATKHTTIPSSDWILYAFLDAMVDTYIPAVNGLVLSVDDIDDMVFTLPRNEQSDLLRRIGVAKRTMVSLGRLLLPKRKIATYLISHSNKFISSHIQFYLRDIMDHLEICLERLDVARENLTEAHNNYLTKVQIEINKTSGRTDSFMNRVTVLLSLFAPLNLIAACFGMNVLVPFQFDVYDNLNAFWGLVAGMCVISLVSILLLRNKLL